MIKRHALVVASVSAILGIMMGVLCTAWAWLGTSATFAHVGAVAKTEAGIVSKVELLEHLRAGRYGDAMRQIEGALDADLIGAGQFARDGVEFSTTTLKAVEAERKAREATGYRPADSERAAVQEAFRLVPLSQAGVQGRPVAYREDER